MHVNVYLDDCHQHLEALLQLIPDVVDFPQSLGWKIVFHSHTAVQLPMSLLSSGRGSADQTRSTFMSARTLVSIRLLQQLIGLLNFLAPFVSLGLMHMHPLQL